MAELTNIKGIGPKTVSTLNKLGINNVNDLINDYPYRYEILKQTSLYEEKVVVSGIIETIPTISYFKNMNRLSFKFNTSNNLVNVVIFNRAFLKPNLLIGKYITVIGKYDTKSNTINAADIKLFDLGDRTLIEPIYHLVKGINNKSLNKYINEALNECDIVDYIPEEIINKYNFIDKKEALRIIHNPKKGLKDAINRCKYEELFIFMMKINALKRKNNNLNIGYEKDINIVKINEFINGLPFELTVHQKEALNDIFKDLKSNKRMNRLLEGDVGSGKTIVALISMYALYLSGYQSALMVPTEVLANQHYENFKNLLEGYNIEIALLTGSTKKSEKNKIYDRLKSGKINMVIGTHAIIEDDIKYNNLGLVITDEQHRFGVNQRNNLRNKGNMPDVLYMSATPIPRTYALTIYGDMDISIINTMPSGRKKIITKVFDNSDIKKVLVKIKQELDLGHQIYIVSPLIEDSEEEMEDTKKLEKKFKLAFKNYNIGVMHGKLSPKEKNKVMDDFVNKKIDILISTTVIEVGVDVKNATMIVIFDAYKFGLATLHQLRGRVGRSDIQSYCVLVAKESEERLRLLEKTSDGFEISEYDFQNRGEGDLFGIKQSGELVLKMANIRRDFKMLLKAKEDAEEFINILFTFESNPEYEPIFNELKKIEDLD